MENLETALQAVSRELVEEVGIWRSGSQWDVLCTLDAPGRDPRPGHVCAYVFWALVETEVLHSARADSDAQSVHVMRLDEIDKADMAFDHYLAIEKLRELLGD
jgi:ADP-ribose pyrophosphatase YjhB (NUDIX family)